MHDPSPRFQPHRTACTCTVPQESEYYLGSDLDPELPRHKIGRTISHASLGSDHGGMPSIYSMANLPRWVASCGGGLAG